LQAAWPERSVGNPFLDRLPGWLDGLHGLDVEGWRRRAREMDNVLPEAVEAEEEFDFLMSEEGADWLHGALAAGALERVAAPHFEDEVAPEGAHVAGSAFGWGGDEEDLDGRWVLGWRFGLGWPDDAVGDGGGLAAGFVGVDAVVTDGLTSSMRSVASPDKMPLIAAGIVDPWVECDRRRRR